MVMIDSPLSTLQQLRSQLEGLKLALTPILEGGTLERLTLALENSNEPGSSKLTGRLHSAQLQSSLAYVLLDLVWILLKLNGSDTHSHPVTEELNRVQRYLLKVHQADNDHVEEQRQAPAVDAQKGDRFIKGALGKRTIFAEDGTVESVVDAGTSDADKSPSARNEEQARRGQAQWKGERSDGNDRKKARHSEDADESAKTRSKKREKGKEK